MSQEVNYSGGILHSDNSRDKVFVLNNTFDTATFTNGGVDSVTLVEGTVLGRVSATNKVAVCASAETDGSQFPFAVLKGTTTVAAGDSATLTYAIGGEVDSTLLVFDGTDTLATPVDGRTMKDHLQLANIVVRNFDEVSKFENQ